MTVSMRVPARIRVEGRSRPAIVLTVIGTRPEVIKMAPVLTAFDSASDTIQSIVLVVGQQQRILEDALAEWGILPNARVFVDMADRRLATTMGAIVAAVQDKLEELKPDLVLVQGDTTTCLAASWAAFYARVPIAHVEAGLRSGDHGHPFPEEMHRIVADRLASIHYVPTDAARTNLLSEGHLPSTIKVVGNTVVDALLLMRDRVRMQPPGDDGDARTLLVTTHRRESFGDAMWNICGALKQLVRSRTDLNVKYVLHPNPAAREASMRLLSDVHGVTLVEPQGYRAFVRLMDQSHIILTDSGGVQEEAPYMGKPVLVTRRVTERPEAADLGIARVVGTEFDSIVESVNELMDDKTLYARMSRVQQPFGDGHAAARIRDDILARVGALTLA